jgi:hypothetical protein
MSRKVQITDKTRVGVIRSQEEIDAEASGQAAQAARPARAERVISIPVTEIFPDPDQPRMPLLPFGESSGFLRERFISGEIDCFQAAGEWIEFSKQDVGHTRRVQFLLDMAAGFTSEDGGQINPVTVVPMTGDAGKYQIETGEQRFWAAVLGHVAGGMKGTPPLLKVVVKQEFSRKRQVLENRHVGPPTVVSQAREIATLFLSEGFLELPEEIAAVHPAERDPFAIHRWVAQQRKPHKSWQALEEIMSMSARQMQRILALAELPTPLLATADRYDLSLRTLREIAAQPEVLWGDLLDLAIHEGWTGADFEEAEIKEAPPKKKPTKKLRDAHQQAFSNLKRFVRTLSRTTEDKTAVIGQVADEIAVMKEEEAVVSYQYLVSITEQIRLRLLERGIIEE